MYLLLLGVSAQSQILRWDSNSGPLNQKSNVQPLKPEKHAEASYNTQSSRMPLPHILISLILAVDCVYSCQCLIPWKEQYCDIPV